MAKQAAETVEDTAQDVAEEAGQEAEQNPLVGMTRKVLLASIGAVALTQEEVQKFVGKLVERGEIAEQDGKNLVGDVMEKRTKQAQRAEEGFDTRMEDLLTRMNVPSKGDIDALSAKITALSKKVDELKEA